jgi:hypothetical protein
MSLEESLMVTPQIVPPMRTPSPAVRVRAGHQEVFPFATLRNCCLSAVKIGLFSRVLVPLTQRDFRGTRYMRLRSVSRGG